MKRRIELHRMKVTLMEGQEPLKPLKRRDSRQIQDEIASTIRETLLPWQLPMEEVKKLCLLNDIPYRWVTGHPVDKKEQKDNRDEKVSTLQKFSNFEGIN